MGVVGASGVHPHLQVIRPHGRVPTWPTWGGPGPGWVLVWGLSRSSLGRAVCVLLLQPSSPGASSTISLSLSYTHVYIQLGTPVCTYNQVHMCIHATRHTRVHTHVCMQSGTHMYACKQVHMYTYN